MTQRHLKIGSNISIIARFSYKLYHLLLMRLTITKSMPAEDFACKLIFRRAALNQSTETFFQAGVHAKADKANFYHKIILFYLKVEDVATKKSIF